MKNPLAGHIFVIEGIDGAGKATQAQLLAETIHGEVVSFPAYETDTGRAIKAMLTQYDTLPLDNEARALALQGLMTLNRFEVLPHIEVLLKTKPVVLDRYWQSAIAYGLADGVALELIERSHYSLPRATAYFLLDIEPAVSTQRRPDRRDQYEANIGRLKRAAENYRWMWGQKAKCYGREGTVQPWVVIDGAQDRHNITATMIREIARLTGR